MQQDNRTLRFEGRHALRRVTKNRRCYDCGRQSVMTGGNVGVRQNDVGVGYAGLASCGAVWLCPVCNATVMARRALEIGAVLTWASVEGIQVVWGSLTCRHNQFSDLSQLLRIQKQAWRKVVSSKGWRKHSATQQVPHAHRGAEGDSHGCPLDCERKRDTIDTGKDGRVGYIRAAELTIGKNGWHPHFHPIIFYRGTVEAAQEFADWLVAEWVFQVEEAGGEARGFGAQQLKVVTSLEIHDALSGYVTKSTYDHAKLALEVVWSQGKTGRKQASSTESHWSLLSVLATADERSDKYIRAAGRWKQLEESARGHRMISWSRGLRDFAGLNDEATDEEIAAEEVGDKEDTVCIITAQGWSDVRDSPAHLGLILSILETAGWSALAKLLDHLSIDWTTVSGLADTSSAPNDQYAHSNRSEEYAAWSGAWGDEPEPEVSRPAESTEQQRTYDPSKPWGGFAPPVPV